MSVRTHNLVVIAIILCLLGLTLIFAQKEQEQDSDISLVQNTVTTAVHDMNELQAQYVYSLNQNDASLGATFAIPTPVALFETSLANKISSSASSMTLVSATDKTGTALASSTYGFIIDEGTASEEMVIADCTATVCTNMTRGISPITGTTTVSALQKEHRRGASVKITNGPQLLILSRILNGVGTVPNLLSYTSGTACSGASGNQTICDKAYIDGVAVAGASNANATTKGIVEMATKLEAASSTNFGSTGAWLAIGADIATDTPNSATRASRVLMSNMLGYLSQSWIDLSASFAWTGAHTFSSTVGITGTTTMATTSISGKEFGANITTMFTAGETISGATTPVPVMWSTTTAKVYVVDGDIASTSNYIGFAVNAASAGGTSYVQTAGVVGGFTGLTAGLDYYVSDTAGTLSSTAGTAEDYVGYAISTTQIMIAKRGSGEYLGSQSLTLGSATAVNQRFARYAVIALHMVESATGGVGDTEVTIYRKGKTSGTGQDTQNIGAQTGAAISVVWNADGSITATASCTGGGCGTSGSSATAYYFK